MAAEPPPHLPPEPGRSHEEQENGVAEPSTGDFTANCMHSSGDLTETRRLLVEEKVNINERDGYGYTAIMQASQHGKLTVLRYLAAKGASLDMASDNYGVTAFIRACQNGHVACAVALVRLGCTVHTRDVLGKSGREYARLKDHDVLLGAIDAAISETTPSNIAAYVSELSARARAIDAGGWRERESMDAEALREELAAKEEELAAMAVRHDEDLARKDAQILRLLAAQQPQQQA